LHLTTEEDFNIKLEEYRSGHSSSQGVSQSFGYYPFIFIQEKAYSGFNEEIGEEIIDLLDS
jgi:hypothetical protein